MANRSKVSKRKRLRKAKSLAGYFDNSLCSSLDRKIKDFNRLLSRLGSERVRLMTSRYYSQKEANEAKVTAENLNKIIRNIHADRDRVMRKLLDNCHKVI